MRFRRRRSRLTIPRHDVINACSGMKRKAARIAQASRPSAHSLLSYSLVPYDTTVSGSAAGGRVKVAEWIDGGCRRLCPFRRTVVLKGLNCQTEQCFCFSLTLKELSSIMSADGAGSGEGDEEESAAAASNFFDLINVDATPSNCAGNSPTAVDTSRELT